MKKKEEIKKPQFTKNGRVTKPDFATSNFDISPDIKQVLQKEGLEGRYVNIKRLQDLGGVSQKGWVPYKIPKEVQEKRAANLFGSDPDGFVRRGDLVLAVKKKEDAEHHRAWLRQEASDNRVNNGMIRKKEQELKDMIKDFGIEKVVKVIGGYGADDEGGYQS